MSRRALLRLGLFQLGAGTVSVLFLGVLNRILRVEMGLDLLLVGGVLGGGHYLGALAAMPFGYYSDRHPIRGLRRTPYILAGITLVCLALALTPLMARALAENRGAFWAIAGFAFFLLEGSGTYIILALGVGMGLFTVGGVSLMMDLTQTGQTGLYVGAWTLAQALAKGPAAIASSGLHNLVRALGAEPSGAYAAVFIVEALGLALAVWLLRQVGAPRFRQEIAQFSALDCSRPLSCTMTRGRTAASINRIRSQQ